LRALTSVGEIHIEPGAIPDLRDHRLALENREMKRGREKLVRDVCHSWPVHQQDCAALPVELPSAPEDDALKIRDVPVSQMILVVAKPTTKRRLTLRRRH
jgi:hypothetical protein